MSPALVLHQRTNAPPNTAFDFTPISLSFEKLQQITLWRFEVDRCCRSPSPSSALGVMEPLIDLTDDSCYGGGSDYDSYQWWDDGFDMDRWTYVPEGGERRVLDLPHPEANPMMSSEPELVEEEYLRVITQWNEFEEEKWKAEKAYRRTPTPENVTHFMKTNSAVKAAGDAARYVELHASRHRLPINFDALFCKHYRTPSFYLYLADPDDWYPPSWGLDNSTAQYQQIGEPYTVMPQPFQPVMQQQFFPSIPPISQQVPAWSLPQLHSCPIAV